MNKNNFLYLILFILIISIGVGIRVAQFPEIPPGLNQDEANSGYETYSLLKTGKDKWGNVFPAYFPSMGSGQNVLMAYLSIPFVKIYGLNIFSTRLVSLILGILTLPLFFFCLLPLGRYPAFLGLLLIAVVPWHFMLSRWALESNILPFFMLLGCAALLQAFVTDKKKWIIPSLVPFALALYAYGTTVIVLPFFFGLILFLHFKRICLQGRSWLLAFGLFLIIASPFFLFFIKNYILKSNLTWTDHLFFSAPLFPSNRIDPINSAGMKTLEQNMAFMVSGFNDGTSYNLIRTHKPLFDFVLSLSIIGFLIGGYKLFRQKKKEKIISRPDSIALSIFFAWGIASLPFISLFELNVNRFNHFYLPCLAISVWLINFMVEKVGSVLLKYSIRCVIVIFFLWESSVVIAYYFDHYPKTQIKYDFNEGLQEAFDSMGKLSVNQILITGQMQLPYVYTLFYLQYPPDKFQKEVNYEISNGNYKVNRFGKYVFYEEYLDLNKSYGYLSRKDEFEKKHRTVLYANEIWEVGVINKE